MFLLPIHKTQDLRFDQVVGSMSHHPIYRNTIILKADTKDINSLTGMGVDIRPFFDELH